MNVFEFQDYRRILADFYGTQKRKNPTYSFAVMARQADLKSRAYIKLVIDGKRNIGPAVAQALARAMKFNRIESRYFETLVAFNQAKRSIDRNELWSRILVILRTRSKSQRSAPQLGQAQHRYYSKWHYAATREAVLLKDFPGASDAAGQWLASRLGGRVTPALAMQALRDLVSLGLLSTADGTQNYTQSQAHLTSSDEVTDFALRSFHREMMERSMERLDDPVESREFTGVTLAIKREDLPRAKQAIKEFRRDFNFDFSAPGQADDVYQLGIQFFPLTVANLGTETNVSAEGEGSRK